MPSETNFELITTVLATADAFLREGPRLFKPFGLTSAQYNVLNVLAESAAPGGLSQRELSDELVVDRSNVTGLLDRMEKAGWVRRDDDPADRRIYRVRLTNEGRKLWENIAPRYEAVVTQITHGLTERQARDTLAVLSRLKSASSQWKTPA